MSGAAATPARPGWDAATDPLARGLFALLVVLCFAAFFVTQRLKHTPTPVTRFERTPTFAPASAQPERRLEKISFKLARAEAVTVSIVDENLNTVATLVRDYPLARYKQFSLRWTGRRGTARGYDSVAVGSNGRRALVPRLPGPLAAPGEYRVLVTLLGRGGRAVYSPWSFTLERR